MAWHASILYARATPRMRACLAGDPVLGPALFHLRSIEHRWPGRKMEHALPPGGLLAVRDLGPPDDRHHVEVPWDALHGAKGPAIHFCAPELLAGHKVDVRAWPPPAVLRYLKDLAHRAAEPVSLYCCEMWGGDIDLEVAWLPGWSPGEPDRVIFFAGPGRIGVAVGERVQFEEGDALVRLMEYHRLRLPSPYFAPHTGRFDWERHRVVPRPPAPPWIPGLERPEPPRPPVPRSLFRCVELGDAVGVAALLRAGCDPNAYAYEGPLERAASLGRADIVELLLAAGADPVPADRSGPLRCAADVACAALLVAAGAPIEPPGPIHPPLVMAARAGRAEVARWLIACGAKLRPPGREHAVFFAACEGGLAWLAALALDAGVDVDRGEYDDGSGRSGLAVAAKGGHAEVVRVLLARGAKLSEGTWHGACSGGAIELVEAHLASGQDVHARVHGIDGLSTAARAGQGAVVRRLLTAGADPQRAYHDESPLHAAAWAGSVEAVEALLARLPADAVDTRANMEWTPLFAAVWRGHRDVVVRLLRAGASRDVVDECGRSLRDEAARRGVPLDEPDAIARPRS